MGVALVPVEATLPTNGCSPHDALEPLVLHQHPGAHGDPTTARVLFRHLAIAGWSVTSIFQIGKLELKPECMNY